MQIMIDIDEDVYKKIVADKYAIYDKMFYSIKNGTPLPKGHGRLIDAKALADEYDKYCATECSCCPRYYSTLDGVVSCGLISDADTIIEADKADVKPQESDHKCHTCKHYTSGKNDGSCGSYICKGYSNWESEDKE